MAVCVREEARTWETDSRDQHGGADGRYCAAASVLIQPLGQWGIDMIWANGEST